ncbi:hypothetical protein Dda_8696 [Drechslerella dactyloides]|uniref:Cep57 centrosome microtubule-binding domain-containing protein n=1 Tax=Drechslerella dactyloides TaxID=74499 RepID=A0AAD6IR32_DREDA|nr:hypothetical protein Dda_8696 [Drechslerella dactyloides]
MCLLQPHLHLNLIFTLTSNFPSPSRTSSRLLLLRTVDRLENRDFITTNGTSPTENTAMNSSYVRSPSQSTTHGSYVHDSDQDAHDLTRLRLQRQLARDLSYASSQNTHTHNLPPPNNHNNESTVGSLGIMEGAAAMSTRRYDDVLLPSTPNLDSKIINAHFKDFSTIGVGVRTRLFPHLSNAVQQPEEDDSIEVGRAGDEHTRTDRESTTTSLFAKIDHSNKGKLAVPSNGKRPVISPNTRARYQPTVADDSGADISTHSLSAVPSRLQGASRRSKADLKATKEQAAREKLEEAANKKENNPPVRPLSQTSFLPATKRNATTTSVFLNREKLFRDMGLDDDLSDYSDVKPDSPSVRNRARAAAKPAAPSHNSHTVNSIKLPDMTGISDLVSSVNHGDSTSRRPQYAPIASVPVPEGERDLLKALRKLQIQVDSLEADRAREKKRAEELQKDYDETRQLYQIEYNGRRELEAELNSRRRVDSALGGEIDSEGGSPRSSERDKLKASQAQHKADVKKLDGMVTAYRLRLETVEGTQEALHSELKSVTEERDSAISSLAKAVAKNEALEEENDRLRQECEEVQLENETFAAEIERMSQAVENYEQALDQERKMMSDKLNRYREKILRAGKVATEATLAAQDATRLVRQMQDNGTQTQLAQQQLQQATKVESGRMAPTPSQQGRQLQMPKEAANVEDRVRVQLDAELRKMFPKNSAIAGGSKRKVSGSTTGSRTVRKPHVKKTRMVLEQFSETESEHSQCEEQESVAQPHMDTTFTAPSVNESRLLREAAGEVMPDTTLHSFLQVITSILLTSLMTDANVVTLQSEGLAALRKEIMERRKLDEQVAAQRQLEEAESRRAQALAERAAAVAQAAAAEAAAGKKRVFIYSDKDNETTITELEAQMQQEQMQQEQRQEEEEEDTPHPFLRTSMVANDTEDEGAFGDILRNVPSRPPSQTTVRRESAHQPARRTSEEIYSTHVQEVIDRLGVHKPELCTICRRQEQVVDAVAIPEVVPVSRRVEEGEGEGCEQGEITMRPSQAPKSALDCVVKQMEDELEHMRLQVEAEFLACDPSLGRRKRKGLTRRLNDMVEEMDKKSDQIYALYDVAEMVCGSDGEGANVRRRHVAV